MIVGSAPRTPRSRSYREASSVSTGNAPVVIGVGRLSCFSRMAGRVVVRRVQRRHDGGRVRRGAAVAPDHRATTRWLSGGGVWGGGGGAGRPPAPPPPFPQNPPPRQCH